MLPVRTALAECVAGARCGSAGAGSVFAHLQQLRLLLLEPILQLDLLVLLQPQLVRRLQHVVKLVDPLQLALERLHLLPRERVRA